MKAFRLRPASELAYAFALAFLLICTGVAHAIGFGEVEVQSRLGEPLLFRVGLAIGAAEKVDESCLSLTIPDPGSNNLRDYFSHARMAVRTDGDLQYVNISSPRPFNELFARVQLQIKCPGIANISKMLTILPDLDSSMAPVFVATTPEVRQEGRDESVLQAVVALPVPETLSTPPVRRKITGKADRSGERTTVRKSRLARADSGRQTIFRLKLSGEPIDESRIGKISPEERELLLAQQKMLDVDDQTAKFLELQHQVKQLQEELVLIRLKLEKIDLGSSASEPLNPPGQPEGAAVPGEKPDTPGKLAAGAQQEDQNWQLGLLIGAGFLLAVLVLWRGLRYYTNLKSRKEVQPIIKLPGDQYASSASGLSHIASPMPAPSGIHAGPPADDLTAVSEAAQPSRSIKSKEELAEDDSMLEEAELYAAHGHSAKAIEILREIIASNPTYTEAWVLLMSLLSSLGKTKDFEAEARNFYKNNSQSESWKMIQALGRTLDRKNPLYAGDKNLDIAAKFLQQLARNRKRLIGDILVEMGVLSELDLTNSMTDFDSRKHGRFGGYLVSRKMITHAQLSEALLRQQGIGEESVSGTRLTMPEMENLLSGFDPSRDGSIGEYLVLHGVITSEQLENAIQHENSGAESSDQIFHPDESPVTSDSDDSATIWDKVPVRDKLDRKREIDAGIDTAKLPRYAAPPALLPALPEIDFDIGSDMKDKPDT